MKLLHIVLFLISFVIGCFFIYISPVEHKIVFVYPTPKNIKKIQYKDNANQCFNFTAKLVNCKDHKVKEIPVQ